MDTSAKKNQPFFAHVSLPKPHQCYTPAQEFWDLYDESKLTLPPNADYDMKLKAPHLRQAAENWRTGNWQLFEPKTFEAGRLRKLHGYLGSVSHVDHAVGELLDWLDKTGLSENTIMVYSSDHGDYACEHGIMEKAPGICSDAITRIPMIWRMPGRFKAGHNAQEIVEPVDLGNTLCAQVGIDAMETSDGRDISRLLAGESEEVHRCGMTEFAWSKSIRRGPYRLVFYPRDMFPEQYPDGFGELYNLEQDPWEMTNLFFEAEHADVVNELKTEMLDWLIRTTRPTTILPHVKQKTDQREIHYENAVNADSKIHPDLIQSVRTQNYI